MSNMKYILLPLLFLQLSASLVLAQSHWGIKGGLISQSLAQDEFLFQNVPSLESLKLDLREADYGFQLGMLYHFQLGNTIFIQPEMLFNSSKYEYTLQSFQNGNFDDVILQESYKYIDFPLQIGLSPHPFQFGAGVVPQIFLDAVSELNDVAGIQQSFDDVTFAWTASAGLDIFKTFKLEVRYENSEELLGRTIVVDKDRYDFDSRLEQWIFSLAIIF